MIIAQIFVMAFYFWKIYSRVGDKAAAAAKASTATAVVWFTWSHAGGIKQKLWLYYWVAWPTTHEQKKRTHAHKFGTPIISEMCRFFMTRVVNEVFFPSTISLARSLIRSFAQHCILPCFSLSSSITRAIYELKIQKEKQKAITFNKSASNIWNKGKMVINKNFANKSESKPHFQWMR